MANKEKMNVSVIVPVHQIDDVTKPLIIKALGSVKECGEYYTSGKLNIVVSTTNELAGLMGDIIKESGVKASIVNGENPSFFARINDAVESIKDEYFSILEFDDYYSKKWFNMWEKYLVTHEDVSLFLPFHIRTNMDGSAWLFGNEIVWANSFSSEMGFIDYDSLLNFMDFTVTGGIYNREDFLTVGGFKESMSFLYGYEYLLRLAKKGLKTYVVPKEGYVHLVDRPGSMLLTLAGGLSNDEIDKWKKLAVKECNYTEDRGNGIESVTEEILS